MTWGKTWGAELPTLDLVRGHAYKIFFVGDTLGRLWRIRVMGEFQRGTEL